jgi:hypothetical protein
MGMVTAIVLFWPNKPKQPSHAPYEGAANGPFYGYAGAGAAGFPTGEGGPISAIFLPEIKSGYPGGVLRGVLISTRFSTRFR